jgi:hypothetical protein
LAFWRKWIAKARRGEIAKYERSRAGAQDSDEAEFSSLQPERRLCPGIGTAGSSRFSNRCGAAVGGLKSIFGFTQKSELPNNLLGL